MFSYWDDDDNPVRVCFGKTGLDFVGVGIYACGRHRTDIESVEHEAFGFLGWGFGFGFDDAEGAEGE